MSVPSSRLPETGASWRSALIAALVSALERPGFWAIALGGFLARGGILVFLVPIVILPTPSGVADVVAPAITSFAFGLVSPAFVVLIAATIAVILGWLIVGGIAGAWADVVLTREAASDEDVVAAVGGTEVPGERRRVVMRAFLVRFIAHLPLWLALSWGALRIGQATYAELVEPFEVLNPLVLRVLADVPDAIGVVVLAWLLGEIAGGLAVRHLVLDGTSGLVAVREGWLDIVRRPLPTLAVGLATDAAVALAVVPSILAANVVWGWVRLVLLGRSGPIDVAVALVLLVALWLGGLVVTAAATTWRSVAWTAEHLRRTGRTTRAVPAGSREEGGTFGGADHAPPGSWSASDPSGTL
jgi:hypothetical protein